MVTAQDCAALAEAVYNFDHDNLVGWAGSRGHEGTLRFHGKQGRWVQGAVLGRVIQINIKDIHIFD